MRRLPSAERAKAVLAARRTGIEPWCLAEGYLWKCRVSTNCPGQLEPGEMDVVIKCWLLSSVTITGSCHGLILLVRFGRIPASWLGCTV